MRACINGATTMPYTFEEDMKAAAAAGFQAVEVWYPKLVTYLKTHKLSEAQALLARHKLAVASLCPVTFTFFAPTEEIHQKLKETAQVAQALSCNTLLVCPDVPPSDISHKEAVRRAADEASRCCDIVVPYGVRLALEPLGRHPFMPGPEVAMEIIALADRPDLMLMMDTFHYYKSGVSLEAIRAIPRGVMNLVHVNSCEDLPREKLTDKHRLWPTLGVIPTAEMIRAVRANGYDGDLSVEVFRDEYWAQPIAAIAAQAKRHLDLLMAQI